MLGVGCPADTWGDPGPVPDGAVWSGWPDCDPSAEVQTISFVHVNDLHASFNPGADGESPYARLRGYYEWLRLVNPYTIFTDGGDAYEKGSLAEILSEGQAVREVTESMGFDVRVLGNHDFAWGIEELLAFSHSTSGLVLAGNVTYTGSPSEAFGAQDWGILEVGCVTVGVFGLVSKPWNEQDEQFDGDYFPEMEADHDVVARAQDAVAVLRASVDLVVMVSHLGLDGDADLARSVEGIDVVLGGHSHDPLQEVLRAGGALILQAGAYARYVARLDVEVDLSTRGIRSHRFRLLSNQPGDLPVSHDMQAAVEAVLAHHAPNLFEPVARSRNSVGARDIARLAARASRAILGVDAALVDIDTVWDPWAAGDVTPQDFLDAFKIERQAPGTPGFNSLYLTTLRGADLERLESELDSDFVLVLPEPLQEDRLYAVAMQKHVALRPDRHLPSGIVLSPPWARMEAWELLANYARSRQSACLYLDVDESLEDCAP
jgi:5'-nucleotidase / UDP-sugar diphosphatase